MAFWLLLLSSLVPPSVAAGDELLANQRPPAAEQLRAIHSLSRSALDLSAHHPDKDLQRLADMLRDLRDKIARLEAAQIQLIARPEADDPAVQEHTPVRQSDAERVWDQALEQAERVMLEIEGQCADIEAREPQRSLRRYLLGRSAAKARDLYSELAIVLMRAAPEERLEGLGKLRERLTPRPAMQPFEPTPGFSVSTHEARP